MARFITWLVGLLLLGIQAATAQPMRQTAAAVTNVRAEVDSQRVKIQYDIVGIGAADSVYIQVESRSAGNLPARTVTGDIGKAVSPGINRTIYWDYGLDGVSIVDDIRATVVVKQGTLGSQRQMGNGGASYALVSALAPGIGNILVQPGRKIGIRPLITVAYAGLLGYGVVQRGQSKKQYALYESGRNEADYAKANQQHHQYLVAVRAAALVWAADVVYTYLIGRKNDRARANPARRLVTGYGYGIPSAGVQFIF